MNTELINEIYSQQSIESSKENHIEIVSTKNYSHNISIEQYRITKRYENKDPGLYTILNAHNIPFDIDSQKPIITHLSHTLNSYLSKSNLENILIVGLGNRNISADSLGAKVVKNIIVTRHIEEIKSLRKVSAIIPSVLGLTGIESFDIVSSVVERIRPTLTIVIDSLCASSYTRLGTSFQINNSSITPGGGVQNARRKLDSKSLGCDFISIGVPLVIYANTFTSNQNEDFNNLIVTLKDIDEASSICAKIIAYSLNMAIHSLSFKDMKDYLNNL